MKTKELIKYTKFDLASAKSILLDINPQLENIFDNNRIKAYNKKYNSTFDGSSIIKSEFDNCIFKEVSFNGTAGESSKFVNCSFFDCYFNNARLDNSNFSGAKFLLHKNATIIQSSDFSNCDFSNVLFENVSIVGCNFIESWFENTIINNCNYSYCNFENSMFDSISIVDSDLSRVSLDYVEFYNCKLINSTFQMFSILRSFNGLKYIDKYQDEVYLKFPESKESISGRKFLNILNDIRAYFFYKKDFFALANIEIYLGKNEDAFNSILLGLENSLIIRDFKEIKYLCKLASSNMFFTKAQLNRLYSLLTDNNVIEKLSISEYRNYLSEINNIKRILIDNPYTLPQMKITIETDIDYLDTDNVGKMIEYINVAYNISSQDSPTYLTISHNSPDIFEFFLSNNETLLTNTYIVLSVLLLGVTNQIVELIKNLSDCHKTTLEQDLLRIKIEEKDRKYLFGGNKRELQRKDNCVEKVEIAPKEFRKHIKKIKFSANTAKEVSSKKRTFEISITDEYK